MIIRLFKSEDGIPHTAKGAVDYVLSDYDAQGKLRDVKPKILQGDANFTRSLDDVAKTHKCVSGVIAFADNEKITDEQKQKLILDFENTFLGNVRPQANSLFVEHYDKGNLEIHFVINRLLMLENGDIKAYNPFPPGQMTYDLKDAFCILQNNKFGFEQIKEKDPLKLDESHKKTDKYKTKKLINIKDKDKLDVAIRDLVKTGEVKNRDELLKFLVDNGYKIDKTSKSSISIVVEKLDNNKKYVEKYGRNIRLSGGIYARNEDKSYQEIREEHKEKANRPTDITKAFEDLKRIVEKRNQYNETRYKVAMKKVSKFAEKIVNTPKTDEKPARSVEQSKGQQGINHIEKTSQSSIKEAESKVNDVNNATNKGSSSDDEPRSSPNHDVSKSLGNDAMGAQMSVNTARTRLANARTIEERIQAEHQLAIAQANLDRVLANLEAQNKKFKIK